MRFGLSQKLNNFRKRPLSSALLWGRAFFGLGLAKFAIFWIPFRRLANWLGMQGVETSDEVGEEHQALARRVSWAVRSASRYTPWNSNCFPQAITAQRLLSSYGIPSTLYLGVAFASVDGGKDLKAHAWLRCGSLIVTGANGHKTFGVVGVFSTQ